jgi:hypothetical protein
MVEGGLMNCGALVGDQFHEVGTYAARILRGKKPAAEMPIQRPPGLASSSTSTPHARFEIEQPHSKQARASYQPHGVGAGSKTFDPQGRSENLRAMDLPTFRGGPQLGTGYTSRPSQKCHALRVGQATTQLNGWLMPIRTESTVRARRELHSYEMKPMFDH